MGSASVDTEAADPRGLGSASADPRGWAPPLPTSESWLRLARRLRAGSASAGGRLHLGRRLRAGSASADPSDTVPNGSSRRRQPLRARKYNPRSNFWHRAGSGHVLARSVSATCRSMGVTSTTVTGAWSLCYLLPVRPWISMLLRRSDAWVRAPLRPTPRPCPTHGSALRRARQRLTILHPSVALI